MLNQKDSTLGTQQLIYMTTFKDLGLSEEIIKSIVDAGYTTPTPVQAKAVPIACEGLDLIASAQTGTGKTAAFVLPMLSRLSRAGAPGKNRRVRALVVTPTRELAMQVEQAVRTYGKHSRFRSLSIYGGTSMQPQFNGLRRGVDIVVATPGRLLDHLNRGSLDLSSVEILVLDEADRMLDMGFLPDIRKVVAATPDNRQTLLFSATMPKPLQTLAHTIMTRPELIEIGERRNPAKTVYQQVCLVPQAQKMDLLLHVLESEKMDNVIIFSRTKHRADRISKKLAQSGFSATVMHSNRTQGQRQRALAGFKNGQFQFMVATDIAARGIDVDSISHVINYDTPGQAEDYIHRIGRTGRADTTGEAITFVAAEEVNNLRQIERHISQKLDRKVYENFALEAVAESRGDGRGERSGGRASGSRPYRSKTGRPYAKKARRGADKRKSR